jgi:LuxR family maltose regulon positive regulatory protein
MIGKVSDPIPRERISSRIAAAAEFPLTVIIAPAGCGKSTALDQYLAALGVPRAYYRVRPGDATLAQFILGLAQDCGAAFPVELAQAIVNAHSDQPLDAAIEPLASVCALHLREHGGVLVIDDLHYTQSPEIVRFVHELVLKTKESLRWIIATRSRKALPLGSWLASGLCDLPIDEATLAFTREDIATAAHARNLTLSEAQMSAVTSATCGWPIGVGLALRYAGSGSDVTGVAAQTRLASYEYLTSHMYLGFSEVEQDFLCFGALLPSLRVDLFEAAGFADAAQVLDGLYQHSSFLSRRFSGDAVATVEYACHDLFRDYLRHQLAARGRDEEQELQKRAADALVAKGMILAGLPLYALSQSWVELAENLARHGYSFIDEGRSDVVESAIATLPANDVRWRSTSLQMRAELTARAKGYKAAEGLFLAAIDCAPNGEERVSALFRFATHQHLHDPRGAERTLEEILSSPQCPAEVRPHASAYLLATRTWLDPYYDLRDELTRLESTVDAIESDDRRVSVLLFACCAATFCGDPRAERLGLSAVEVAQAGNMLGALLALYGTLARNALYRGDDPAVVMGYVAQLEAVVERVEIRQGDRASILLKMGLAMRAGDATSVEYLLQRYPAYKFPPSAATQSVVARAQALLRAWKGAFGQAYELLIGAWQNSYGMYRPVVGALCAVFAAAAGRREDVRTLLEDGTAWLQSAKPWNDALLRNTELARQLYAFAAAISGRHREALRLMRQSPALSGACVQALADAVRALLAGSAIVLAEEDLVSKQLCELGYGDIALTIRAALRQYQGNVDASVTLTAQQTEVLEALAVGLAPKQIAEMMDRRLSTVQGHIRDAIAKLGCSGREQAIRIARSRGLLKR